VASQRPSSILIQQYNLIETFKKLKIALIVNVQKEGEHPYCGPNKKLEETSGFAYDPHVFISEDIKVRRTGWKDMSVPDSMSFMLEIVKEMAITINEKNNRVLVHCHAGYGRTGVVIVCYLIYVSNKSVHEIIEYIREKRQGSVQKDTQYKYCQKFKSYIDKCRPIFGERNTIEFYMKNQNDLLYGEDLKRHEFIPKLISVVLEKVENMLIKGLTTIEHIYQCMFYPEEWTDDEESILVSIKREINMGDWSCLNDDETVEVKLLFQLLYDWLEDCVDYVINPDKIYFIFQEKGYNFLIEQHIQNTNDFTKNNRKNLWDNIGSCLRTIESETLSCIALFFNRIKPVKNANVSDTHNYIQVSKRFCAALLGFETQHAADNNEDIERMVGYALRLVNLITFFGIVLEKDTEDEIIITKKNCFSAYYSRRKILEGISARGPVRKLDHSKNEDYSLMNEKTTTKKASNIKININNSFNSPSTNNKLNEQTMFEVYKVLGSYFINNKDKADELEVKGKLLTTPGSMHNLDLSVLDKLKNILRTTTQKGSDQSIVSSHNGNLNVTRRTKRAVTFKSIKENLIKYGQKGNTNTPLVKLSSMKVPSEKGSKANTYRSKHYIEVLNKSVVSSSDSDTSEEINYKEDHDIMSPIAITNGKSKFNNKSILKKESHKQIGLSHQESPEDQYQTVITEIYTKKPSFLENNSSSGDEDCSD
jgi:hypothetical protein